MRTKLQHRFLILLNIASFNGEDDEMKGSSEA